MQRAIDLLDDHYQVKVFGRAGTYRVSVENDDAQPAVLTVDDAGAGEIRLGDQSAALHIAVRGETAYIRAFGRTFTLQIADPVEQAAQASGALTNSVRAPMPGVVVKIEAASGDRIAKGQPLMTIESMKMLTVITAHRDGEIARVHVAEGQTFEKSAVLVTFQSEKE